MKSERLIILVSHNCLENMPSPLFLLKVSCFPLFLHPWLKLSHRFCSVFPQCSRRASLSLTHVASCLQRSLPLCSTSNPIETGEQSLIKLFCIISLCFEGREGKASGPFLRDSLSRGIDFRVFTALQLPAAAKRSIWDEQ